LRKKAVCYKDTSLTRNSAPLGPYSRTMPRALRWSKEGGLFLISKVTLDCSDSQPAEGAYHDPPEAAAEQEHRHVIARVSCHLCCPRKIDVLVKKVTIDISFW